MRFDSKENIDFFIKNSNSKTRKEWADFFKCEIGTILRWVKKFNVSTKACVRTHSEKTKIAISEKRKKWLAENPEKHPWKRNDKLKSEPCERVKEFLTKLGIFFVSEFTPEINGRFFSIDIALPDKKIALEINGNQHYNRDGSLKPYYQERHNLLTNAGWTVFEVHYSVCFNLDKWTNFADQIKNASIVDNFDYFNYSPRSVKVHYCVCGEPKCQKKANRCKKCNSEYRQKILWPSKEEMSELVLNVPTSVLSKQLNVSDSAIGKFCKKHGIQKPSRGSWTKTKSINL